MKMSDKASRPFQIGQRNNLIDSANVRFPQLYVDGEFVGGLDIVKEMVDNGEFDEIVQANGQVAGTA